MVRSTRSIEREHAATIPAGPGPQRDRAFWAVMIALLALVVAGLALGLALGKDEGVPRGAASASPLSEPSVQAPPSFPGVPAPSVSPVATPTFDGPAVDLSLPGFGGVVVDGEHEHVFVSGGAESNDIVVLDFEGNIVKRLTDELGASGMVVHGSELFVALRNADRVDVIDTATLKRLRSLDTTPETRPFGLAWVGDRLWVAKGNCAGSFDGAIFALDPSTGRVSDLPKELSGSSCPMIVPIPGADERVLVPTVNGFREYAVRPDGRLRLIAEILAGGFTSAVGSPDGRYVLGVSNDRAASYSAETLEPSGTDYVAQLYVNGIDTTTGDAPRVVVGAWNSSGPDVWLYRANDPEPYKSVDFGSQDPEGMLYNDGVAFAPDGSRVFAVTGNAGNNGGEDVFLRVIEA